MGLDTYTPVYINNLLCSTRNSTQYSVMAHVGKGSKKEWTCVTDQEGDWNSDGRALGPSSRKVHTPALQLEWWRWPVSPSWQKLCCRASVPMPQVSPSVLEEGSEGVASGCHPGAVVFQGWERTVFPVPELLWSVNLSLTVGREVLCYLGFGAWSLATSVAPSVG